MYATDVGRTQEWLDRSRSPGVPRFAPRPFSHSYLTGRAVEADLCHALGMAVLDSRLQPPARPMQRHHERPTTGDPRPLAVTSLTSADRPLARDLRRGRAAHTAAAPSAGPSNSSMRAFV